jgi:hypothetical protein
VKHTQESAIESSEASVRDVRGESAADGQWPVPTGFELMKEVNGQAARHQAVLAFLLAAIAFTVGNDYLKQIINLKDASSLAVLVPLGVAGMLIAFAAVNVTYIANPPFPWPWREMHKPACWKDMLDKKICASKGADIQIGGAMFALIFTWLITGLLSIHFQLSLPSALAVDLVVLIGGIYFLRWGDNVRREPWKRKSRLAVEEKPVVHSEPECST